MQHDTTTLPASYPSEPDKIPSFSFPPQSSLTPAPVTLHRRRASHKREPSIRISDEALPLVESLPRIVPSTTSLPAFTFNPAASMPTSAPAYTPLPTSSLAWDAPDTPTRPSRHGKSISEFVAGQNSMSSPRFRSVSPKKQMAQFAPSSSIEQLQTPPFRRHGHRRSGAISQDLSMPGKSDALTKFGLSPEPAHSRRPSDLLAQRDSSTTSPPAGQSSVESLPRQAHSRSRVLFVEAPEYISRPLSTVSSGTDSSMSTIRLHAPTSSTSPVHSNVLGSPVARVATSPLAANTPVGAVFSFPNTTSASESINIHSSPVSTTFSYHDMAVDPLSYPDSEGSCSPVPLSDPAPIQLSENFDEDPTSTIISDSTDSDYVVFTSPATTTSTDFSRTDKSDSPIIDLDSALSPFRDGDDGQEGASKGRGFSKARRSMHSSHMLSGFFGPGMHYHRRVESAPSFGGFDYERLDSFRPSAAMETGFTMEDVNEEEEDALAASRSSKRLTAQAGLETPSEQDATTALGLALSDEVYGDATPSEDDMHSEVQSEDEPRTYADSCTTTSELELPLAHRRSALHADRDSTETGLGSGAYMTSSGSTVTSAQTEQAQKEAGLPLPFPQAFALEDNAVMSAEPTCACDAVFSTMHSNLGPACEEKAVSRRRASVDDVPSLMSSRSTATSTANRDRPSVSLPNMACASTRSGTSTPSVSSSSRQRRKRSSIASLSKLMANGFRERSLSPTKPDSTLQAASTSRDSKENQGRRFGRLLKLLRPK